jgi:hypothetical protein
LKRTLVKLYNEQKRIRAQIYVKKVKPNYNITFFEGGLGSQLLAFIEFQNKNEKFEGPQFANLSYFESNRVFQHENGLTHWKWRLDHYGHRLEDFNTLSQEDKILSYRRPTATEQVRHLVSNQLLRVSTEILSALPILSTQKQRNKVFFNGSDTDDFGVIHLRKGDYLKVASRVLGVQDLLGTLSSLKAILPSSIVLVSDGRLDEAERISIERVLAGSSVNSLRFHDGSSSQVDETVVHDLMRKARFLMTSNSTFSFSAGLLNTVADSLVVFPLDFYGDNLENVSFQFRSRAQFGILERSTGWI